MYYRSPSRKEIDRAADVLEIGDSDRSNMHNFYRRERMQNREANIKLLKALGIFALKVIGISLAAWALFQTWEERLPK
jgi:hypothetical protein